MAAADKRICVGMWTTTAAARFLNNINRSPLFPGRHFDSAVNFRDSIADRAHKLIDGRYRFRIRAKWCIQKICYDHSRSTKPRRNNLDGSRGVLFFVDVSSKKFAPIFFLPLFARSSSSRAKGFSNERVPDDQKIPPQIRPDA